MSSERLGDPEPSKEDLLIVKCVWIPDARPGSACASESSMRAARLPHGSHVGEVNPRLVWRFGRTRASLLSCSGDPRPGGPRIFFGATGSFPEALDDPRAR